MGLKFKYTIKVNGLSMQSAPTFKGAQATVTQLFHGAANVTIERDGEIVWQSTN